jgi:hypothetical protein
MVSKDNKMSTLQKKDARIQKEGMLRGRRGNNRTSVDFPGFNVHLLGGRENKGRVNGQSAQIAGYPSEVRVHQGTSVSSPQTETVQKENFLAE